MKAKFKLFHEKQKEKRRRRRRRRRRKKKKEFELNLYLSYDVMASLLSTVSITLAFMCF